MNCEKHDEWQRSMAANPRIPLDECVDRGLYKINSRNLTLGVYVAERQGFIGIREKFGSKFLFTEFHYDTGPPFGTASPYEYWGPVWDTLDLVEGYHQCKECGEEDAFDFEREPGKRWYHKSGREDHEVRPVFVGNKELQDYLQDAENAGEMFEYVEGLK